MRQNEQHAVPPGYREDAKGHLIPEAQIKPIDLQRDELVLTLVAKARDAARQLQAFKAQAFADIAAHVELSAGEYGVKLGGNKGNVQLTSFDGRYKVLRAISENITFDERLQAAKKLIDECLNEWSGNAPPELSLIVKDAFDVDKQGNVNTGKVLTLRRYRIEDERWLRAMDAISDAIQVTGTKPYVRIYQRDDATGDYVRLPLDLAGV